MTCFVCGGALSPEKKCRTCGAAMQISQVTGNVIWVRNGRVVAAFQDSKDAWVTMARRYGIPESDWPEQFKPKE